MREKKTTVGRLKAFGGGPPSKKVAVKKAPPKVPTQKAIQDRLAEERLKREKEQLSPSSDTASKQLQAQQAAAEQAAAAQEAATAQQVAAAQQAAAAADSEPPPSTTPQGGSNFDPDALITQYNNSPAAQDFGLTVTYDPDTNEMVEDTSAFGFTGDNRYKRYSLAAFAERLGTAPPATTPQGGSNFDPPEISSPEQGQIDAMRNRQLQSTQQQDQLIYPITQQMQMPTRSGLYGP